MITWLPYPNPAKGQYAQLQGLVLVAEHSGAWAVFDPLGIIPAETSMMAPILSPPNEQNIVTAKAKAIAAAERMLTPEEK